MESAFTNFFRSIHPTYLSRSGRDGIGTLSRCCGTGCQRFAGPLPSAFLDKCYTKNCCKSKRKLMPNRKNFGYRRKRSSAVPLYQTGTNRAAQVKDKTGFRLQDQHRRYTRIRRRKLFVLFGAVAYQLYGEREC
jgi:hypothetical protein